MRRLERVRLRGGRRRAPARDPALPRPRGVGPRRPHRHAHAHVPARRVARCLHGVGHPGRHVAPSRSPSTSGAEPRGGSMSRYTVISADCHAGPSFAEGGFLDYVDPGYRDRLRERHGDEANRFKAQMEKLFAPSSRRAGRHRGAREGGRTGAFDPTGASKELEADGIVADVIFPDGTQENGPPFEAASGPGRQGRRLGAAGRRGLGLQPVARRLLRHAPRPTRRARADDDPRHRRGRAPGAVGRRSTGCKGVLLPAGVGDAAVLQPPALRADLGGLRGRSACRCTPMSARPSPDYGDLPGSNALFATREPVVLPPPLLVPDLGRRVRAPPGAHDGVRRAGCRLGARPAPHDGQHVRPHVPPRAGAAVAQAQRILAAAVLRAGDVPGASEANERHQIGIGEHDLGLRLPALRGQLAQQQR